MNGRALIRDSAVAFLSQGVSLLASVVMSLLVPKVLGIQGYGYWQLFIFYTSYVGFFHLGLNDGVYLLKGGQGRDEIDKASVASQLRIGLVYQFVFAGVIACCALASPNDPGRAFVLFATAFFLLLNNTSLYLGYIFQAMNETKLYSFSTIIDRLVFLVPLVVFVVLRVDDFEAYVVAYAVSKTCALVYCARHARDILTASWIGLGAALREVRHSISVGVSLMFANVADMLILGVARFLIDANWGIEVFGEVSFSFSLVNFFITFVAQASMVLFPALRQSDRNEVRLFYRGIRDVAELVFPAVYLFYFPMAWFIGCWLPQYSESIHYFAMLLPVCLFNSKMNICSTTYFKVLREERLLLLLNIVTAALSALTTLFGVFTLHSVEFVLSGVVAAIILRSLASELWLNRELELAMGGLIIQELALTVIFIAAALLLPGLYAFALYAALYGLYIFSNRSIAGEILRVASRCIGRRV